MGKFCDNGGKSQLFINRFFGFTLGEVLLTLGIIGVIAGLVMPTLIADYQKKAQAIKIRKVTNEFIEALDLLITQEGKTSLRHTSLFKKENGLENFMNTKFHAVPCNNSNCFAQSGYKSIDKTKSEVFQCKGKAYLLADSTAVCVQTALDQIGQKMLAQANQSCQNVLGGECKPTVSPEPIPIYEYFVHIAIDTNGNKRPNVGGRDMFWVSIDEKLDLHAKQLTGSLSLLGQNKYMPDILTKILFPIASAALRQSSGVRDTDMDGGVDANQCNQSVLGLLDGNTNGCQEETEPTQTVTCQNSPFGEPCIELLMNNHWKMNY